MRDRQHASPAIIPQYHAAMLSSTPTSAAVNTVPSHAADVQQRNMEAAAAERRKSYCHLTTRFVFNSCAVVQKLLNLTDLSSLGLDTFARGTGSDANLKRGSGRSLQE